MSSLFDRLLDAIESMEDTRGVDTAPQSETYPRVLYRAPDYSPLDQTLQDAIRSAFRAAWKGGKIV